MSDLTLDDLNRLYHQLDGMRPQVPVVRSILASNYTQVNWRDKIDVMANQHSDLELDIPVVTSRWMPDGIVTLLGQGGAIIGIIDFNKDKAYLTTPKGES